jgi:hypothetical protein
MTIKSPQTGNFSSIIFGEISSGALDKCKKLFPKVAMPAGLRGD